MKLRPLRVLAIARRDWAAELRGRRGLLFGGITTLLLLPAATIKVSLPTPEDLPVLRVFAAGDVPDAVAALPEVHVRERGGHIAFRRDENGLLIAQGQDIPRRIREALDGPEPRVRLEPVERPSHLPGRTILFALISASLLTGSVSESIGGERSRRTLQALLAAAVTRGEIVVGKWFAWAGYGAATGLAAALIAVLLGRVSLGWWLLPLPMVAASMVALAMYLSRHAGDVVGGATVSLRYLPAVLSGTGLIAWYLGDDAPLVGALLPIGGALLAAGDAWPGAAPALVATASSGLFTAAMLVLTTRDLEQHAVPRETALRRLGVVAGATALCAMAWWTPVAAPLMWGAAGNPRIIEALDPAAGVFAGGFALALFALVRAARSADAPREIGLTMPRAGAWALALAAAFALAAGTAAGGWAPWTHAPLAAAAQLRLDAALQPTWAGFAPFALVVVGQELMFRGWLQRLGGPVAATLAFAFVAGPIEPLTPLLAGAALAAITVAAGGSVLPAIAARLGWALLAPVVPADAWGPGLAGLVVVISLAAGYHMRVTRLQEG